MTIVIGDLVTSECQKVGKLPIRLLKLGDGDTLQYADDNELQGLPLISANKQDFINAFARNGLQICNPLFGLLGYPLELWVKKNIHITNTVGFNTHYTGVGTATFHDCIISGSVTYSPASSSKSTSGLLSGLTIPPTGTWRLYWSSAYYQIFGIYDCQLYAGFMDEPACAEGATIAEGDIEDGALSGFPSSVSIPCGTFTTGDMRMVQLFLPPGVWQLVTAKIWSVANFGVTIVLVIE